MSEAQLRDPSGHPLQSNPSIRPWLRAHGLANALLILSVAVLSAQWVLQHANVCGMQIGTAEAAALALGVLITGAVFNWVSMDVLLSEVLPISGHLSITLSILASVVLMAGAIRAVSIAMRSQRWNAAGMGWSVFAGALACMYATSSALGFCVTSRTWLV